MTHAGTSGAPSKGLVVFAADSLKTSLTALQADFEAHANGLPLQCEFGSPAELRGRIQRGALADLVLSDEPRLTKALVRAHLAAVDTAFARNPLAIVVPRGNPDQVERLMDLLHIPVALAGPGGALFDCTRSMLTITGRKFGGNFSRELARKAVLRAKDGVAVVAAVAEGRARAGIGFAVDARTVKGVEVVEIPAELNAMATCALAVLERTKVRAAADSLIALLRSTQGLKQLAAAGFAPI